MNAFLTGGLGFAGHYFTYGLLKKGYRVILLGRDSKQQTLGERKSILIENNKFVNPDFQIEEGLFQNLTVLNGDISLKNLGLSDEEYKFLQSVQIDEIYNASAILRYENKYRSLCQKINVEGTRQLLELATEKKSRFIHISTAFITGEEVKSGELIQEKFYTSKTFPNVYIESKANAEELISEYSKKNNLDFLIFRLPGLIGDSKTGFSNSIFGFYEYIGALAALQKRAKNEKIIRFCAPPQGAANLLPTDIAIKCTLKICDGQNFDNPIFNITDSEPLSPAFLAETLGKLYDLPMVPLSDNKLPEDQTRIEKLFARLTRQNSVLANHDYNFDSRNSEKHLGHKVSHEWDKSIHYFELLKKGFEDFVVTQ